ncbi:actin-related protein 2/3 complex subunit 5 [Lipomyces oligophaga]|uniref:actin-related protein 2/3 complex subunit 5 n=1 Tax=Lipomyces oligophaga TaxID=45792 RepID=UPI0034CEB167
MEVNYRRINVDLLDPENIMAPEELIPPSIANLPPLSATEVQAISQAARTQLGRGDYAAALATVLDNPPYTSSEDVKNTALMTIIEVLSTTKSSDMSRIVEKLTSEQRDTLVKYLYKGMNVPEAHGVSGVLLAWFEKVTDLSGPGAVSRYLSDRRLV